MKKEGQIYKKLPQALYFLPQDFNSYYLSKFSDEALTSFDYCKATNFRTFDLKLVRAD